MYPHPHATVLETIVRQDRCCCCGLCSAMCPQKRLNVIETEFGEFFPAAMENAELCGSTCGICLKVCPVHNTATERTNVPSPLFNDSSRGGLNIVPSPLGGRGGVGAELVSGIAPTLALPPCGEGTGKALPRTREGTRNNVLGNVHQTFVGAVANDADRLQAPSGGLATAMLCRLLEENKIDAAVIAQPIAERPWFERRIVTTAEEILGSRGSVYHVLKSDDILREILADSERRYAIVALPCLAKAIRLAGKQFPKLSQRIPYVFSLTCGGCNTLHVPDVLTVMLKNRRAGLRYRNKNQSKTARDYSVTLAEGSSSEAVKMLGPFGFLWINHAGQLTSCLYCNDVFGYWADATFMDAWLPEYIPDTRGTSLAISRNPEVSQMFVDMFQEGSLQGGTIMPQRVLESQEGLIEERHRFHRIFSALIGDEVECSKEERHWGKRYLAYHQEMRFLFRYYSYRLARKPNWYSRFYLIRLFWLVFVSLTRHRLLGKTLHSLHFLKKKGVVNDVW